MPSDLFAIEVNGLSKLYRKGVSGSTRLTEWRSTNPSPKREFWALKEVSFNVEQGHVLGIVGRNGAGKSTLLKILAQITPPTKGEATIRGRVASLLEVGTGFHHELTGRENVLLSGAILGMSRREIQGRMHEIVDFSGIGDFIDTPVKRYSSGMYVRLGFAVAAHLDADVLLVDEVLAVGDAEFRKRCLGRIGDITKSGRTVILVSHDMSTVSQLCDHVIWIEDGRVAQVGPPVNVVGEYLRNLSELSPVAELSPDPTLDVDFSAAEIGPASHGGRQASLTCDDELAVRFAVSVRNPVRDGYLAFYLRKDDGAIALFSDSRDKNPDLMAELISGTFEFEVRIPPRTLAPGTYSLTLGASSITSGQLSLRHDVCSLALHDISSIRGDARPGATGTLLDWRFEPASS